MVREMTSGTELGNLLLKSVLVRMAYLGLGRGADVVAHLFDLHDLQVFLCMLHIMWFTYEKGDLPLQSCRPVPRMLPVKS